MVKLSVIIPVYNAAAYLRETIESVLNQSLKEIELICVDDGSTDESLSILREYEQADPRVMVLQQQNQYAGIARNNGLKHASGEYVHFLDADDYVLDYAYEALYNKAVKYDLDVLRCAALSYDTEQEIFIDIPRNSFSALRPGDFNRLISMEEGSPIYKVGVTPWSGIYRRSFLMEHQIRFNGLFCVNDRSFFWACVTNAGRMMIARDRLTVHRTNQSASLIGNKAKHFDCNFRSIEITAERLEADGIDLQVQRQVLQQEFTDLFVWYRKYAGTGIGASSPMEGGSGAAAPAGDKRDTADPAGDKRNTAAPAGDECHADVPTAEEIALCAQIRGGMEQFTSQYQGAYAWMLRQKYRDEKKRLERSAGTAQTASSFRPVTVLHDACEHPKVSVVVPTYNVEDYLNEALHSLTSQTLEEMEFICINDGSTDGCLTILKEYAALDRRFRILDGPNRGYGVGMNRGVDAARGEYLGILEPDDFVPENMYAELYETAVKNDAELIKADFYRFKVNPDGSLVRKTYQLSGNPDDYNRVLCPGDDLRTFKFVMNTWSGIYRLDFLRKWKIRHNETPGASYQDNGFFFQTFCRAKRAYFVNRPYYMNRRDNPGSSMYNRKKIYCVTEEYQFIEDWMKQDPALKEKFTPIFYTKKFSNFMVTYHRLAREYQRDYLYHIRDEFIGPLQNGLIDRELFGEEMWQQVHEITADPQAYFEHICVSVIIPVYNAASYLRQTLDSLLCFNEIQFEVICVDDGSTDESFSILREYERQDSRVRVYTQENAGAGAARNHGMQYAHGEYLSFLDADDFFEPDLLRRAYDKAHVWGTDITVFRSDQYQEDTGKFTGAQYTIKNNLLPAEEPFAGTDIEQDIFGAFVGWAWDKLFRADFVRENGLKFQEIRTSNDMLFTFSAITKAQKISTMNGVLAHHRRTSGTLSVTRERSWDCFYQALCALKQQLLDWGLYERFEQDFINYSLHFTLWNVNSIRGEAFYRLYDALKDSWLTELGILSYGIDYFYRSDEYQQLQLILELDAEDYLYTLLDQARSERDRFRRERDSARKEQDRWHRSSTRFEERAAERKERLKEKRLKISQMREEIKALRTDQKELKAQEKTAQRQIAQKDAQIARLRAENEKMRSSFAWKIGRGITWPVRKLKRLFGR